MKIHIVDVFGGDACLFEGQGDGAGRFFWRVAHADTVEGLAGGSVTGDLGVDARATRAGVYVVLKDKHPGTFSDHESIAVGGKRPRGALRRTVPGRRERAQQSVALNDAGSDWRIDAPDEEHGLNSRLNVLI